MSIKRKKSPLILNSLNINKITTYDVENPVPGLGQAKECGGVNVNVLSRYKCGITSMIIVHFTGL
jgi:hypothetical protein